MIAGVELEFLHHVLNQFRHWKVFALRLDFMRLEFRELEQIADQFAETLTVLGRDLEIAALFLRRDRAVPQQQGLEVTLHRCQRGAQIVRNISEQLASPYIGVREQLELLRDALRHFLHRNAELVDVVALRVDGCQAYGLDESALTKAVDCLSECAQAPSQHLKDQQLGQQREQYGADDEIGRQLQKPATP